ncbi:Mut7-C RNAse domain-containing protein [Halobellus captivus]|uniref:Mut7-C RNAse domain-containing protein n=1 Tax=Halobellus captivus TaxID=2592614 RepID=UPI0011A1816C|nr:Mut7-C RNAse domain-containing protein [Halobellus captivus]
MPDRLLVDAMCGKLTTYLRMCGYDAAYVLEGRVGSEGSTSESPPDDDIAAWAKRSGRTLLTRDVGLVERIDDAVVLTARDTIEQLGELHAAGYALALPESPTRCSACNGELRRVGSEESLPPETPNPAEEPCWRCRDCGQVFWKGSHWDDVAATLTSVTD